MSDKLSRNLILTIGLLGLAGEIAWSVENQFFNLFVYDEIAPVPLYVSFLVATSALTMGVTAITMGVLSDKLGRRKVFFLIGFPLWALTTAMFPFAGLLSPVLLAVSAAIFFDCLMTFFGSMTSDATLNAYITDITDMENRGLAISIRELGLLNAILITYGLSGYIIDKFGYFFFFYLVGAVVGIIGTIGAIIAPEPQKVTNPNGTYWLLLKTTFHIEDLKQNKDCFLVLFSVMIWGIGFNIMFPFLLIYIEHNLVYSLTEASIIVFIALLISIFATIPTGVLVDKLGRKKLSIIAIIGESFSLIFFSIASDYFFVLLATIGFLFAMMIFDVSSKTWTKDLFPEEKRGQFSGYYILFTVLGAMILGPLIGGVIAETYGTPIVIDGIPGYVPPSLVFMVAGITILLAIIPLIRAKDLLKI